MRRSLLIFLGLILAGVAITLVSYRLGAHLSASGLARSSDDLEWLRQEFHLGDPEMSRIRRLHESYLPVCRNYCERIAAAKARMAEALGSGTNVPVEVDQRLAEIGSLRAQCQAAMLRHFAEVSRAMPEPQGRRYLAEMRHLTLALHDQMENAMASPPASHEHHGH